MNPLRPLAAAAVLAAGPTLFGAAAELAYPPRMAGARTEVYKTAGGVALSLHLFEPAGGPRTGRPAIVFFFGGGWTNGSPVQFETQCRHLAARGMVAITADYRIAARHGVKPVICVGDAKSALRWVRANAARLGIDPARIAAGGGSAGGHLAAATAFVPGFDDPADDLRVSPAPAALVLFNPVLVLAPLGDLDVSGFGSRWPEEKLGAPARALSPAHHLRPGAPPILILHGEADVTVPYALAEGFARRLRAAGNRCDLIGYPGQPHGFFNHGRAEGRHAETIAAMDAFLVTLGWLPSPAAR